MIRLFLTAVAFLALAALGGWAGIAATDRDYPVEVKSAKAINSPVKPGEVLRAEYIVYRYRSCQTKVYRYMYLTDHDGVTTRYVLTDLEFPAGALPIGEDRYVVPATVPASAVPTENGLYRVVNSYACNLIHKLFAPIETPPRDIRFEVK